MRQNKQTVSLSVSLRRWLWLACAACLCLAAVNFERARAQQPGATPAQKTRSKRIAPLRTSDTADGSRVTITSDGELNDYSAYRSGDRFIVVVPQAEGSGGGGARGKGFEGAQVERRGKDLVYTFKLQPGATARVNQRFNRLDVQFSAAKGANANASGAAVKATPTPTPTPTRRTTPEEAGITKPPANVNNAQPTPDARRTPDANANNNAALAAATPFAIPSPTVTATPDAALTPALSPTPAVPAADQIAQVQPSIAPPTSITTNAPTIVAPTSVGAVVTRNWPWLLVALLAVGIGLFFVSRFTGGDRDRSKSLPPAAPPATKPAGVKETQTPALNPPTATTAATTNATKSGGAFASATGEANATTGAASAATGATAAALATSGKQSKKKKKKAEKAKRHATANDMKAGDSAAGATGGSVAGATTQGATGASMTESSGASMLDASGATARDSAGATTRDAGGATTLNEGAAGGAIAASAAFIAGAAVLGGAAGVKENEAEETKAIEATQPFEPPVAFDSELIEIEIKKLLAGESYDESIVNATDKGTRQLVSAELMQAIGGRNAVRQGHARTAFLRHGYFEEATRALQSAEAPGERAAAARTLGILGDRTATPHLTAALEDPSADVRRTSVEALAELQDPSAVGALEALRWRETSRQVPRTLIQRAIEASKVEEEATTPDVKQTATGEAATKELQHASTPALAESPVVAEESPVITESAISVESPVSVESAVVNVEEADATADELTVESPAPLAAAPAAASAAFEETTTAGLSVAETLTADEETKAIELREPQPYAFTAPHVASEEALTEAEADTFADARAAQFVPVETDLATTLAAKEASLIEARKQESGLARYEPETKAIEPVAPAHRAESPMTSFDMLAESDPAKEGDYASPPAYVSDFAAGSGRPAVGDEDWIDLDEQEVTIQTTGTAGSQPAEPLGTFYAEGADAPYAEDANAPYAEGANARYAEGADALYTEAADPQSLADSSDFHTHEARTDGTSSLFDSLEIETFETNAIEPAAIVAAPVAESARIEEADTKPLTSGSRPETPESYDDLPHDIGLTLADKGLSVVDGSDESDYSIIPKGIQLRLASDDASERAQSVLALARLNTDEAFDQICAAFDDPMEEVRNAAARAIYDLNDDRADSFTRALRESPVERRRHIGAALAGSGLAEEAIGNLTGESRDKTYDAFSLLFLMAKAGEVAPLIRSIESHPDNEVRLAVVKLLALSGQHEILPSFRRLAVRGSLPTEVRSAVMEAIYQISSQPNATTPTT
ncbi:MAG TPA: HEAT repeat domain-containing protein [Pyrinomonadaceae bacterium]|nr:HEAT repeat domain-containing protein [Pyrinomonadaceae bacterium]